MAWTSAARLKSALARSRGAVASKLRRTAFTPRLASRGKGVLVSRHVGGGRYKATYASIGTSSRRYRRAR